MTLDAVIHALHDFYRCYIEFNMLYSSSSLIGKCRSILQAFNFTAVLAAAVVLLAFLLTEKWYLKNTSCILICSLAVSFGASIIMISISGRTYGHYYMVMLPCLILPIIWAIKTIIEQLKVKPWIFAVLVLLILHIPVLKGGNFFRHTLKEDVQTKSLVSVINKHVDQKEPILVSGINCKLYLLSGNPPATRYPWYSDSLTDDDYIAEMIRNEPMLIVDFDHSLLEKAIDYFNEKYTMIYEYEDTVIYKRLKSV